MKTAGLLILSMFLITDCTNRKVEITNDYIINEYWTKENEQASANSIVIDKMKPRKDSVVDPFSPLTQAEILSKLEEDSSFMRYANVKIKGQGYRDRKIYFDRDNGFCWGSQSFYNSNDCAKMIGILKPRRWYRFSDLGLIIYPFIYVYIDSENKAHRFNITAANY
jgi:hypothetical protein